MPFGLRLEYTFRKWTAIAKRIKDIPNVLRQGYIQFLRRRNELIARKREFGLSLLESMLKDIPTRDAYLSYYLPSRFLFLWAITFLETPKWFAASLMSKPSNDSSTGRKTDNAR